MAHFLDDLNPQSALMEVARDFHARGWMAGTAGNLSVRDRQSPAGFWITASSLPKGRLEETDFLCMDLESEQVLERLRTDAKPSAETAIHRVIYQLFPEVNACLHVHSVDACLATAHISGDDTELPLPPLEMIKGLGIWEQSPNVSLPVFTNWLDVPTIAAEIQKRFSTSPPAIPALMIHGHGTTVWGRSLQEAYNRTEIVEFLMSYLAKAR